MAEPKSDPAVRAYFESVTDEYLRYGGHAGWHYGVWDADISSHAASLVRATERLFAGLPMLSSHRVLDIGCGAGDLARWCARAFGCQVLGITISEDHAALAAERARAENLDDRCQFRAMDMNALDFAPHSFDVVVNQESLCYAVDPRAYLKTVRNVLRPGGVWTAIAFSRCDELESEQARAQYQQTLDGFQIPHLCPPWEISAALHSANFDGCLAADLTQLVAPTAESIVREAQQLDSIVAVGASWAVPGLATAPEHHLGHFIAGRAYSEGLLNGWARHMEYRATAPSMP